MKSTLTFLFASCLIMLMASYRQADVPGTREDTIPKPQYQYFVKVLTPYSRFYPALDTIDMVMKEMGKTMTVDRAESLRGILYNQLNVIIGRPVMDSVKVGGKP